MQYKGLSYQNDADYHFLVENDFKPLAELLIFRIGHVEECLDDDASNIDYYFNQRREIIGDLIRRKFENLRLESFKLIMQKVVLILDQEKDNIVSKLSKIINSRKFTELPENDYGELLDASVIMDDIISYPVVYKINNLLFSDQDSETESKLKLEITEELKISNHGFQIFLSDYLFFYSRLYTELFIEFLDELIFIINSLLPSDAFREKITSNLLPISEIFLKQHNYISAIVLLKDMRIINDSFKFTNVSNGVSKLVAWIDACRSKKITIDDTNRNLVDLINQSFNVKPDQSNFSKIAPLVKKYKNLFMERIDEGDFILPPKESLNN